MNNGLLFLSLWLFGFVAFTLLPMLATLFFSFINLNITDGIFSTPKFVGLDNYAHLFKDPQAGISPSFWFSSKTPSSFLITIKFALYALPVGIFAPLLLALRMNNRHLKGQFIFRSLFYMPYIVPFVASIFLWGGMLNTETGWINRVLIGLGMAKDNVPQWANDVNWVYPTYVIMGIWGIGNAMLIMLAGLQGAPTAWPARRHPPNSRHESGTNSHSEVNNQPSNKAYPMSESLAVLQEAPALDALGAGTFSELLQKEFKPTSEGARSAVENAVHTLAAQALEASALIRDDTIQSIAAFISALDQKLTEQINLVLHQKEFQTLEGAWRGLHYLSTTRRPTRC